MTLTMALHVLADGLTRDDHDMGFTVQYSRDRYGKFTDSDYVEAWKTVRQYIALPVEPSAFASRDPSDINTTDLEDA